MAGRQRTKYVISYDIAKNSPRTKLATLLLDYGERLQKSVFQAELSREEVKIIQERAAPYVEAQDSLCFFPLCRSCVGGIVVVGRSIREEKATFLIL